MIDKETFKKEYIRMMDSLRDDHKGEFNCFGVDCNSRDCPINDKCNTTASAFDIIEAVEQWAKKHPIVTNADKFKEVFGVEPRMPHGEYICPSFSMGKVACVNKNCHPCREDFWEAEYKAPKKEEV